MDKQLNTVNDFGRRRGILLVELIVASAVLITIMVVVTTICLRIQSTWKDVREQRRVVAELSSRLDNLTMLPRDDLESAIASLAVSSALQESLRNPKLTGRIYEDALGNCVELTMTWEKNGLPDRDVSLSAWHVGVDSLEATRD